MSLKTVPGKSVEKHSYILPKKSLYSIALMIACGFCVQWTFSVLLNLILDLFPNVMQMYKELLDAMITYDLRTTVYIGLAAPVVEELFFRILIIYAGTKLLPFWIVNIIQSIIFGIYHGNIVQGIYAFILGMLLGFVLYDSRTFYMSIILHMSINIFGILIDIISKNLISEENPIVYVIAVITAIAGTVIIWKSHILWSTEVTE